MFRSECDALPKGWIREEVPRIHNNMLGGKSDIYYISPMGKRIRSKPELMRLMGDVYDLRAFDYVTGKINPSLVRPKPASRFYIYSTYLKSVISPFSYQTYKMS